MSNNEQALIKALVNLVRDYCCQIDPIYGDGAEQEAVTVAVTALAPYGYNPLSNTPDGKL